MPKRYEGMAYWEIVSRQMGILSKSEQERLKDSKIAVIGCGGIGGAAIEMLARMGIGNLQIVDKDTFSVSNINRQLMSSFKNVGKPKTDITKKAIQSINPFVNVKTFEGELNNSNVENIIKESHLVVDALDNLVSRIILSRSALKLKIPFIHGAIHGTMGQVTVFNTETPNYEELFKLPSQNKELTPKVIEEVLKLSQDVPPVLGPVPNIVGCLQASESLKIITKKGKSILAPKILNFDLMRNEPFSIIEI
ncbi:MAG: HesA/MoeB/ThiF family protein [Methanobacteriaceae archaeon]|nr:HesA/MoeB/ThiF family protein [Methanobacteriaceae archaeon]MDZ4171169.1 HesA/MoeB/ThiF family protein [Methanobacteriaceae archaeon]